MPITPTRPRSEDIRFRSDATGEHILDTYLEAAEIGGKTLAELLTAVFDTSGQFDIENIQFRIDPTTRQLQVRIGIFVDPEAGWTNALNGTMFHDRGTWSSGISYQQTDLVTNNHDLWLCKTANSDGSFDQAKWSRLIDWAELDALRTQVRDDTTSVTTMKSAVETSESNAAGSATAAANSASASQSSRLASESARDASQAAQAASESARDAAQLSESNAATSEGKAKTSETNAAASAASAIAAADTAFALSKYAMTRAEFDAKREQNKRQYKGSGWLEWGKHYSAGNSTENINQGLWTDTQYFPNGLYFGRGADLASAEGISKTQEPIALVDGVQLYIEYTADGAHSGRNKILYAPAPDGTKTYDSATSVVTTHASAAEAFEGLITNGDFRNGATSWIAKQANGITVTNGTALISNNSVSYGGAYSSSFPISKDITYIVKVSLGTVVGSGSLILRHFPLNVSRAISSSDSNSTVTLTTTAPENLSSAHVIFESLAGSDLFTCQVHSVSVMPTTESVITSRQDFSYLDVWYEAIDEKDIFCPLGNTQFGATSYETLPTVPLTTLGIGAGYSKFGEWQSDGDTVGRGLRWSTLTDAQKRFFLGQPENNIFYDAKSDKLIQVRYRIKSVKGVGNQWRCVSDASNTTYSNLDFDNNTRVKPQGKNASIANDLAPFSSNITGGYGRHSAVSIGEDTQIGAFYANGTGGTNTGSVYSFEGRAFALPICIVQRLNQGAFHPGLNPWGCRRVNAVGGWSNGYWYQTGFYKPTSTGDCFNITDGNPTQGDDYGAFSVSGYISSGSTGRTNQYLYYDAIYAGQVQDLRLPVREVNPNTAREALIRNSVTGTVRGKGRVPVTKVYNIGALTGNTTITKSGATNVEAHSTYGQYGYRLNFIINGGTVSSEGFNDKGSKGLSLVCYVGDNGNHFVATGFQHINHSTNRHYFTPRGTYEKRDDERAAFDAAFPDGTAITVYAFEVSELSAEFDSLPYRDIIGSPANIAAVAQKLGGSIVGQWIPSIPDGTSKDYELNEKAVANGYYIITSNNGTSWSNASLPIDLTTNTVRSANAANVVALWQYETLSAFTEPAGNSKVVGDVGDVWTSSEYRIPTGNRLAPSLVGNVLKASSSDPKTFYNKLTGYMFDANGSPRFLSSRPPEHVGIKLPAPNNGNAGIKALPTIIEKDGLLWGQFHAQTMEWDFAKDGGTEFTNVTSADTSAKAVGQYYHVTDGVFRGYWRCLFGTSTALDDPRWSVHDNYIIWESGTKYFERWNGNGWGDDSTMPIVSGESTVTDLNGNVQRAVCHHTKFPIGIA